MRENVFNSSFVGAVELPDVSVQEDSRVRAKNLRSRRRWSPDNFAHEQIRGLVRQVFFSNGPSAVRQVVFCAVEAETGVGDICRQVGEMLALETMGSVAVAGGNPQIIRPAETMRETWREPAGRGGSGALRQRAMQATDNLWLVPAEGKDGETIAATALHSYLREMRAEFDYSIVEGAPAAESHKTTAMAQFADGIILVLSAQRTRRATARKTKEALADAGVRILGTVLSDREFPIPEAIYRRL